MAWSSVLARPSCRYGAESRNPQSGGVRHSNREAGPLVGRLIAGAAPANCADTGKRHRHDERRSGGRDGRLGNWRVGDKLRGNRGRSTGRRDDDRGRRDRCDGCGRTGRGCGHKLNSCGSGNRRRRRHDTRPRRDGQKHRAARVGDGGWVVDDLVLGRAGVEHAVLTDISQDRAEVVEQEVAIESVDLAELRCVARRAADLCEERAACLDLAGFAIRLGLSLGGTGQVGNVGDERVAFRRVQVEAAGLRVGCAGASHPGGVRVLRGRARRRTRSGRSQRETRSATSSRSGRCVCLSGGSRGPRSRQSPDA